MPGPGGGGHQPPFWTVLGRSPIPRTLLSPPPLRGAEDIVDGVVVVGKVVAAEKKVAAPATKRTTSNPFRPPRRRAMKRNAPIDHRGRANPHTVIVPLNMESPEEPSAGGVEDAPCRCICPFTMTILLIGCDIACLPLMIKADRRCPHTGVISSCCSANKALSSFGVTAQHGYRVETLDPELTAAKETIF